MTEDAAILRLQDVSKDYAGLPPVRVLQHVEFSLAPGDRVAVTGPSGSGKSTLLNLIGTLDVPTSGHVFINGRDVATLPEPELARMRNREIGFVFQGHHLLPQCTVLENVLVPTLRSGDGAAALDYARDLLQRAGLAERLHHRPAQLSGGERQRAAVVRALINRPSLLLADEPTGSLNDDGARQLADLLLDLCAGHAMAMVVVTHSMMLANRVGRVLDLRHGQLAPRE